MVKNMFGIKEKVRHKTLVDKCEILLKELPILQQGFRSTPHEYPHGLSEEITFVEAADPQYFKGLRDDAKQMY